MKNLVFSILLGLINSSTLMASGLPNLPTTTTPKPPTVVRADRQAKSRNAQSVREKHRQQMPGNPIRFEVGAKRKTRIEDRKETSSTPKNTKLSPTEKKVETKDERQQRELSDKVLDKVISEQPQR